MTIETILTDEIITELATKHLWAHAQFIGAGEVYYEGEIEFARAIEQAVLQSEQVQALRKDAERYRWFRDGGNDDMGVATGFDCVDIGSTGVAGTYREGLGGEQLDKAIDAAIGRQE